MFTLPLAKRFSRVVAVESFKPAADFAEENATNAGLRNVRTVTAPVEFWIAGDRSPIGKISLAVFDPPRTGAGKGAMEALARMKPTHIAAVSCDPATFAQDIRVLLDNGYELNSVTRWTSSRKSTMSKSWRISSDRMRERVACH